MRSESSSTSQNVHNILETTMDPPNNDTEEDEDCDDQAPVPDLNPIDNNSEQKLNQKNYTKI